MIQLKVALLFWAIVAITILGTAALGFIKHRLGRR